MPTPARFVVTGLVLAVLGAVALWRKHVADDVEETARLRTAATEAMSKYGVANDELGTWFPAAIESLSDTAIAPQRVAAQLASNLLPKLDHHLAVFDTALAASAAYLARESQPSLAPQIDKLKRRNAVMHELRDTLAAVHKELAREGLQPVDLERIAQQIQVVATKWSVVEMMTP